MTLRVSQSTLKFANDAEGNLQVSQTSTKYAVDTVMAGELRVSQTTLKFAVQIAPLRFTPPAVSMPRYRQYDVPYGYNTEE
jgi:hypothetical protein